MAKLFALLFFLLPWVTISCAQQPLVSMSGVDLATGHVMMTNPMTGATERPPGANGGEMLVIVAAVLILAALAATFILKGGNGLMAAAAGAGLAALALAYDVLVRIPAQAHSNGAAGPMAAGGPSPEQIAQMIQVRTEIGFWLTLLALAAAVVLNVLALRSTTPAAAPPAGGPA